MLTCDGRNADSTYWEYKREMDHEWTSELSEPFVAGTPTKEENTISLTVDDEDETEPIKLLKLKGFY